MPQLTQLFHRYRDMASIDVEWDVEGIITPKESVEAMLRVIPTKTIEQSGTFWTWEGKVRSPRSTFLWPIQWFLIFDIGTSMVINQSNLIHPCIPCEHSTDHRRLHPFRPRAIRQRIRKKNSRSRSPYHIFPEHETNGSREREHPGQGVGIKIKPRVL
jgi:hypothetical protein